MQIIILCININAYTNTLQYFFSHLGFVFYFIFLQQITVILLYCKKKYIRPNILKSVYLERETISFFVFDTILILLKADMDMILLKADVDTIQYF